MEDNFNKNSNNNKIYDDDYFREYFSDNSASCTKFRRNRNTRNFGKVRGRKGLKWTLLGLLNKRTAGVALALVAVIVTITIITSVAGNTPPAETAAAVPETTVDSNSHRITGVPLIAQDEYLACCETYACTMLMQYLKFDLDVGEFVNNYLFIKPVEYGEDGNLYGPDMNSAFAGDIYGGYGIYAPAMAKCMNKYIKTTGSKLTAYPLSGETLESLCKEYVANDIPVMIWTTANMAEPYEKESWIVDYVDENSKKKIGDSEGWQIHEHCMVLVGFDEENYYFNDSIECKVSGFEKSLAEKRYSQIGMQAIVVK